MGWTGLTKQQEEALAAARTCGTCGAHRGDQAWEYSTTMHVNARPRHYWVAILSGSEGWEATIGGPGGVTVQCPEHSWAAFFAKARAKKATGDG